MNKTENTLLASLHIFTILYAPRGTSWRFGIKSEQDGGWMCGDISCVQRKETHTCSQTGELQLRSALRPLRHLRTRPELFLFGRAEYPGTSCQLKRRQHHARTFVPHRLVSPGAQTRETQKTKRKQLCSIVVHGKDRGISFHTFGFQWFSLIVTVRPYEVGPMWGKELKLKLRTSFDRWTRKENRRFNRSDWNPARCCEILWGAGSQSSEVMTSARHSYHSLVIGR